MDTNIVVTVIIVLIPMILSLSVHEFAHAWMAFRLGDDTAARAGRLTLNPLAHVDPIGTLLLPILLTIQGGGFFFGWAKPVPVNRLRFRRGIQMRTGDILTAVAGPVSNILIAFLASGVLVFVRFSPDHPVHIFLIHMFFINIALAVFNLLPVPPLDGHYLLPQHIQETLQRHQMMIFVVLLVAINVFHSILTIPILFLRTAILGFWMLVLGGMGG